MSATISTLAHAFAAAGVQSAADAVLERRRNDIMATVGICLALRAMDEEGDVYLAKLGEVPSDLLTTAIITALDEGKSLDEATAAVIAAMEGD